MSKESSETISLAVESAVPCKEKQNEVSKSREAENRREKDHESSRKKTSVVKAMKKRVKLSDSFARADQHASAPLDQNLGSNRNCGPETRVR